MRKISASHESTVVKVRSKSLLAAIALNTLLPGAGYLYMERWVAGILGGALVVAIFIRSPSEHLLLVWMFANFIMMIDMCLLKARNNS